MPSAAHLSSHNNRFGCVWEATPQQMRPETTTIVLTLGENESRLQRMIQEKDPGHRTPASGITGIDVMRQKQLAACLMTGPRTPTVWAILKGRQAKLTFGENSAAHYEPPLPLDADTLAASWKQSTACYHKGQIRHRLYSIQKPYLVEGEVNDFAYGLQQSRSGAGCCRLGSHARSVSVNPFSLLPPGTLDSPRLLGW